MVIQTTWAIKRIKLVVNNLLALKILANGKRILQTNANDLYQGVELVEEKNGKRSICGYKSGMFKEFENHYHFNLKSSCSKMEN